MKRVMVDIETLSTRKDAAVLSIGAVMFDDTQILDSAGYAIDMRKMTGHIDPSTVKWWLEQSDTARAYSFSGTEKPDAVASWLGTYLEGATEVWANDPDFDMVILQNWWERTTASRWPANFRNYRSVRTMTMLAQRYHIETAHVWTGATAHNPIEDAACQARAVIEVFKALDRRHGEMLR